MYDKLEMRDKEIEACKKLADFLFGNLVSGGIPKEELDWVMARDMQVITAFAMRSNEFSNTPPNTILAELLPRLDIALRMMALKAPFLIPRTTIDKLDILQLMDMDESLRSKEAFIEKNMKSYGKLLHFLKGKMWREPEWPLFLDELIRMNDLMATIAMSRSTDKELPINAGTLNILLMKLSNHYPINITVALSNLASAYYIRAENVEVALEKMEEENKEENKATMKIFKNLLAGQSVH
ncbi:unnamed protein product [Ambrosiozyma monospora]|uniref:Unnamed protein product n=1 Tax=Ambrosiozyma monospora TaxID=43982 RepID=A0ACB5TW54_AMBMO|nr:unnamed protein product [Ambrosiozyma monospora]